MLVAALADVHGNLPALEAVLADLEREDVDAIVVAGDTISGPWPAEVFDAVAALGARVVHGNADREVLERSARHGPLAAWCAERLGAERLAAAAAWPATVELEVGGLGRVLVCHSTPASDEPIYTRISPEQELVELLAAVDADVLLSGHTHVQYDRRLATGLRVVNPGSVGMPYEDETGAYWALLGPDVVMRRTEYDVSATVAAIREREVPIDDGMLGLLVAPHGAESATIEFERLRGT